MNAIDPERTDLAQEFRDAPFGPHSAELQKILYILRWQPIRERRILVTVRPGKEWRIGILPRRRGLPIEFESEAILSYPMARWLLFKRRWEIATGLPLELPTEGDTQ